MLSLGKVTSWQTASCCCCFRLALWHCHSVSTFCHLFVQKPTYLHSYFNRHKDLGNACQTQGRLRLQKCLLGQLRRLCRDLLPPCPRFRSACRGTCLTVDIIIIKTLSIMFNTWRKLNKKTWCTVSFNIYNHLYFVNLKFLANCIFSKVIL